jgi:hypothetical protein
MFSDLLELILYIKNKMKFKNYILFLALISLVPLVALAETVMGQAGLQQAALDAGFGMETNVYVIATRWINGFLSIFGMLSTYFIITAGFNWMTSGGNAEKVLAAKATLKNVLWGLIIGLMAYTLARFVLFALADTTGAV